MPDPSTETLQRVRRIETRLTQTMIALGVDTASQKPRWDAGDPGIDRPRLVLPSRHTSLKEMTEAVPAYAAGKPVDIFIGGELIGQLSVQLPDNAGRDGHNRVAGS